MDPAEIQLIKDTVVAAMAPTNITSLAAVLTALAAVIVSPIVSILVARRQIRASARVANNQVQASIQVATSQIRAQTVSANRQAWINTLRENLAEFLSQTAAINLPGMSSIDVDSERFRQMVEQLTLIEGRIKLSVNPNEEDHVLLVELLDRAVRVADTRPRQPTTLANLTEEIVRLSQTVLKREWERVKSGE